LESEIKQNHTFHVQDLAGIMEGDAEHILLLLPPPNVSDFEQAERRMNVFPVASGINYLRTNETYLSSS